MNNCAIIGKKLFLLSEIRLLLLKMQTEMRIKMNKLSRFLIFVVLIFH